MLVYLGVDYEDCSYEQGNAPRFSNSAWEYAKNTLDLDFPNLPYYIDEDVRITESLAIMKYIAVKYSPATMLGKSVDD